MWQERRWFRRLGYVLGAGLLLFVGAWFFVARDLPSTEKLLDYQPPLPTIVRGIDGQIVYSYARERRVQLRFVDFPKPLIDALLSAEDKTFWSHGGVDYPGLAGAVIDYVSKMGSGQRAKGGSIVVLAPLSVPMSQTVPFVPMLPPLFDESGVTSVYAPNDES